MRLPVVVLAFFLAFSATGQTLSTGKTIYVASGQYLLPQAPTKISPGASDSLEGFNDWLQYENLMTEFDSPESVYNMQALEQKFIATKYRTDLHFNSSVESAGKPVSWKNISANNLVQVAPCVNEDFESTLPGAYSTPNAVAGWTVTSRAATCSTLGLWSNGSMEFAIVTTPVTGFPGLGTIGSSPLGGNRVARLGNFTPNTYCTRLSTTFPVTSSNALFQYAFAGYFEKAGVNCCDMPAFQVQLLDCFNNTITCQNLLVAAGYQFSCSSPNFSFTGGNANANWVNWQVRTLDLSPYIGSCITLHVICRDESFGGRYASVLFDARCGTPTIGGVSYCPGSGVAQLVAPQGYTAYAWQAPAGSPTLSAAQVSLASITVSNPVAGAIYTVTGLSAGGCTVPITYTLNPTTVSLQNVLTKPTCPLGSAGSATVFAGGSSLGYSYSWVNTTNSVVSTSSVLNGATAGDYTVLISVPGSSVCGSLQSAVSIGTVQSTYMTNALPFCGTAYLYAPIGSNYQWYNATTPVSGSNGTLQSLSVPNASNGAVYHLGYTSQGCRDSVSFFLNAISQPGNLFTVANSNSCTGTPGGSATVLYTPVPNNPYQLPFTYTIQSAAGFNPAYLFTLSSTSTSFTAGALYSGHTYSLLAFDGLCVSSRTMYVNPVVPEYNFSVGLSSPTVCSGYSVSASINLNIGAISGQYTFSWTPNTFLSAGNTTLQTAVLNPTAPPGSTSSVVYSIVVTPTAANCPVSNTFQLITANPLTPTVAVIPALCKNAPSYSIQVLPPGGNFISGPLNGVISPSLFAPGNYFRTYVAAINSCAASKSFSFTILPEPTVGIYGSNTVCAGYDLTLYAYGAASYVWSNAQTGSVAVVSPTTSATYSVTGTSAVGNCQSGAIFQVNTLQTPAVSAIGNFSLCAGETAVLTASGAISYTWVLGEPADINFFYLTNPLLITPASNTVLTLYGSGNENNCIGSVAITLNVDECLSISKTPETRAGVQVYPNPGNGRFSLETEKAMRVRLYNGIGELIYEKHCEAGIDTLDLGTLSEGIYPLVCESNNERFVVKLIRQK